MYSFANRYATSTKRYLFNKNYRLTMRYYSFSISLVLELNLAINCVLAQHSTPTTLVVAFEEKVVAPEVAG